MATKRAATKKAAGKAVATKPTGSALAALMSQVAGDRKAIAKAPGETAQTLSFRNGTINYQGREVGHDIDIIILRTGFERAYFEVAFDPKQTRGPDCYSFDGESPHPDADKPQCEMCTGCEWDEFETAHQGSGKACKEGIKIACLLVPKGIDPDRAASLPIVTAKFSVMNSKVIGPIIDQLYERFGAPAKAIMTLSANPDPGIQISNDLTFAGEVQDEAVLDALVLRFNEAEKALNRPYPKNEGEAKKAAGKAGARKRGGTKRSYR